MFGRCLLNNMYDQGAWYKYDMLGQVYLPPSWRGKSVRNILALSRQIWHSTSEPFLGKDHACLFGIWQNVHYIVHTHTNKYWCILFNIFYIMKKSNMSHSSENCKYTNIISEWKIELHCITLKTAIKIIIKWNSNWHLMLFVYIE